MIIKNYEINKINLQKNKFLLFYGKNEGFKNDVIETLTRKKEGVTNYEEKEIFENEEVFLENIFSKSLFDDQKIIIIKRATEKILKIIEKIEYKEIQDLIIIINADNLDKKSKLRSNFEKNKQYICIAFYEDNDQTLSRLTYDFLKKRNISISSANINLIINKCNGDRSNLKNELNKIESLSKTRKKITSEDIMKLTNMAENHSISDLIDNCLAKNQKKTIGILNENNFSSDDSILILRTFLNKSKKVLFLSKEYKKSNNIDATILSAKPPIFWKDKEIVKQQIFKWSPENTKKLIYELLEMELLVKKNLNNSINLICDFILKKSSLETNN
tara:strand:- start:988 stop:1980 length:993 start_codon:yes stop_codon:yes gene_type:complete